MIRKTFDTSQVVDFYKKEDIKELERMYPNVDIEGKYMLFIQATFYFPYVSEKIDGHIEFVYEDDEIINYASKCRNPYSNKAITLISKKNKQRLSKYSIPLIFDTFEDLNKLKRILIKWKINASTDNNDKIKVFAVIEYKLKFHKINGKNVYSIKSSDCIIESYMLSNNHLEKYMEEFQKILIIQNESNNNLKVDYIKGDDNITKNELEELGFITIMKCMDMKNFIDIVPQNKMFRAYYCYSEETLEPDIASVDLQHI